MRAPSRRRRSRPGQRVLTATPRTSEADRAGATTSEADPAAPRASEADPAAPAAASRVSGNVQEPAKPGPCAPTVGQHAASQAPKGGPRAAKAAPCAPKAGSRGPEGGRRAAKTRPHAAAARKATGQAAGHGGTAAQVAAANGDVRAIRAGRRWLPQILAVAVLTLLAVEFVIGWPSLASALARLRAPQPGWIAAGLVLEIASMIAYALMQRHLLRSAGVRAPLHRNVELAYAAHSLSATLPGGTAFSTRFNYRQMRGFGATPAVASWAIALSGVLSAAAFAVISAVTALAANGIPQWRTLAGLAVAAVLLVVGVRWITARPDRLEAAARATLARVNTLLHRPREQGLDNVRGFAEQLRAARLTAGHGAAAAVFAVLNWLLDAACLWITIRAVGDKPLGGTTVLLAFCAGMAAGSITILPGGLGIVDNALVVGLVAGGTATATAIAAVVLYRLLTLGFIVGAGWVAWFATRGTVQGDDSSEPFPAPTTPPAAFDPELVGSAATREPELVGSAATREPELVGSAATRDAALVGSVSR